MKRLLTLTLALLMALSLFAVGGWRNYACAEEEAPANDYVGLWRIIREESSTESIDLDASDEYKGYLDFLPSGAIYLVTVGPHGTEDKYLAYMVTGENTLEVYDGSQLLSGTFDPETGIILLTWAKDEVKAYIQRVTADPLPDIRALVDHSQEEKTYY